MRSKGPTSDFIDRFLRERPQAAWGEMKQELTVRFAEIVDPQHALTLLRKIKQRPKESVQLFAERLLTLSEDAFDRDGAGTLGMGAEQQLVAYFIDGLSDYYLKAKILLENAATFRAAVTCATNEQNVQDRIQLRLGKPVREKERVNGFQGHMRPLRCFKCGGPHKARDCRKNREQCQQGMCPGKGRIGQSNAGNAGVSTSGETAEMGNKKTANTSTKRSR